MKQMLVEIRKENKDLKAQLNLVNTKVDKQTELIKNLQASPSVPSREDIPSIPPVNPPRDNFNFNSTATAAPPWSNLFSSPPQQRQVLVNDSFRNNIAGNGGAKPKHTFGPKAAAPSNKENHRTMIMKREEC